MLRRLFIWLLPVLLLALSAAGAWLVSTEAGLRFALERGAAFVPGEFTLGEARGRLVGPLEIDALALELEGMEFSAERLALDWRPWRFIYKRELRVLTLSLQSPVLALRSPDEPGDASAPGRGALPQDIELPIRIEIDQLEILQGRLLRDGQAEVEDLGLALSAAWRDRRVTLRQLELGARREAIEFRLEGSGQLRSELAGAQSLDLDWTLVLPEVSPPLRGVTRLRGPLAALSLEQRLSGLVNVRLGGELRGLPALPAWDLRLALAPLAAGAQPWPETLAGAAAELHLVGELPRSTVEGELQLPQWIEGPLGLQLTGGWDDGAATLERARLALADGGQLTLSGSVTPGDALALELALDGERLGWPLDGSPRAVEVERLTLQASGRDEVYGFRLQATGGPEVLPALGIEAEGGLVGDELRLARLAVSEPEGRVRAQASGRVQLAEQPRYDFAVTADARLPEQPPLALQLAGSGDTTQVTFERLQATLLEGSVEGQGRIGWGEGTDMDFRLAARELNPGSHYPGWQGSLGAELTLDGRLGESPDLAARLAPISGTLRNRPVGGELIARLTGDTLAVDTLALQVGTATAQAQGELGDTLDLRFAVRASNLNDLMPGAGGRLDLQGQLAGRRDLPEVILTAEASALRYAALFLGELAADIDLDASGERDSRLTLTLAELRAEETVIDRVQLDGDGRPDAHRLSLATTRGPSSLELEVTGGLGPDLDAWSGSVEGIVLELAEEIVWRLQTPAALAAGPTQARLETACMDGALGRLCLAGDWQGGARWHGELGVSALDLEGLTRWLGDGLVASGTMAGNIVVDTDGEGFAGLGGGLAINQGRLYLAEQPEEILLGWQSMALALGGDRERARGQLLIDLAEEDRIDGSFEIAWNDPERPLAARFDARLGQLGLIAELVPDLAAVQGELAARLEVAGPLAQPAVSGRLSWTGGAAQIPTLGIAPREIEAIIDIGDDLLDFRLAALSGDGRLESRGRFSLTERFAGNASLTGTNLLLVDLPEARVLASPEIGLDYRDNDLQINGVVDIPVARITGILRGTGAISESPDTVIVGERARNGEGLDVGFAVRVNVGPEVSLDVAGLRGRVEGSLLAMQGADGVATGRGEVRVVDGSFGAFGQRLTIQQGRLLFTGGAIDDPGLDIRAVRVVDDITAGAMVRGSLNAPEISVFSEPPLPRAEALSYLTIGKSINELDSGEQASLNSAANSLALSGGNLLAREIGGRLGFDEVGVAAGSEPGSASLVVGKYLGPRLFVSYGVGLFDAVNELRVRYRLSTRWTVEAASGEQSSADVIFTVER